MIERVRRRPERRPEFVAGKMGVTMKATKCKYCGHLYIHPCDEKKQAKCPNTKLKKRSK